jgi:hypothetical protein
MSINAAQLEAQYNQSVNDAKRKIRQIKAGKTGHTRPDVAINQYEHGLALQRRRLKDQGIDVPYFNPNQ